MKFAIQKKGRLRDESFEFLAQKGIKFLEANERSIILNSEDNSSQAILVRDDDIPTIISQGGADMGIIGKDLYLENQLNLKIREELEFGKCRFVIAVAKNSQIKKIEELENQRIATSYPNILKKFLNEKNIKASVIKITGSVEATPKLGLADAVADITQSGKTLVENGLIEICEILKSNAILISK